MSLLTKAERQSLDRPQRVDLRRTRRAQRTEARMAGDGVEIDDETLAGLAGSLVVDMALEAMPGPEKMDAVLDELVEHADEFLVWTWCGPAGFFLELIDGPALRALVRVLIRPHVQRVYERIQAGGAHG